MWQAILKDVGDPIDDGTFTAFVTFSNGATSFERQYTITAASKTQTEDLKAYVDVELAAINTKVKAVSELRAIVGKVIGQTDDKADAAQAAALPG